MTRAGGEGHDAADIVGSEEGVLENEHAAHGATNDGGYLLDAEVVEDELVDTNVILNSDEWKLGAVVVAGIGVECARRG